VGGLMKRLDIGEGSYSQELEEDYEVLAAMDQVMGLALANEEKCQEFRQQYLK
jgi:dynein heavy chain